MCVGGGGGLGEGERSGSWPKRKEINLVLKVKKFFLMYSNIT